VGHDGRAAGQAPLILPGSLEEREVLQAIDEARHGADRHESAAERRRGQRRYWGSRARHEA